MGALQLALNAHSDPANNRDSLAVADGLVSRAVRAFVGGVGAPWDQGVVVREALQAFALFWR